MGIVERRTREKEQLREAILETAGQLILEDGFANLSMRKIAARIEYAPSTIYLYFKDKTEILAAICIQVFDRMTARLVEIANSERDPLTALRKGLRCYIEFGVAHPHHYMVTFSTVHPPDDGDCPMRGLDESAMRCYGTLDAAVRRCIKAKQIRAGDPNAISQVLWTSIHGLTSLLIVMGADDHFPWVNHDSLIDAQIAVLVGGLRAHPRAKRSS